MTGRDAPRERRFNIASGNHSDKGKPVPTNRRHRKRRRTSQAVEPCHIMLLADGCNLLQLQTPNAPEPSELWQRVCSRMLPIFVRHHPGRRPWAWWEFEATIPRERIVNEGPRAVPSALRFGYPSGFDGCAVNLHTLYESQADYLHRRALLLDGEREILAASVPTDEAEGHISDECVSEIIDAIIGGN